MCHDMELLGSKAATGLIAVREPDSVFPEGKGSVCLREFSTTNLVLW